MKRFLDKIDVRGPDECWPWLAGKDSDGYGIFTIEGRPIRAHRFAYEFFVGPIPDGLTIDHLCFERACMNPKHMEPCPRGENARRGKLRRSSCPRGHPYSHWIDDGRGGYRTCRICNVERTREWRARTT